MKLLSIKQLTSQYKIITSESSLDFIDPLFYPDHNSIFSQKAKYKNQSPSQVQSFLPHEESFLVSRYTVLPKDLKYSWKRLNSLNIEYGVLSNPGPSSLIEDVIQGEIGNCYFISAMKFLSEVPKRISGIITSESPKGNTFEVTVYINGIASKIIIDDYFPTINDSLIFARINPQTNNIWPLLLEKAWAKCNNTYEDTIAGSIGDAFEFLTPAPIRRFYHDIKYDYLYEKMCHGIDSGYIVCCDMTSINDNILLNKMGVISNHGYKVIGHGELVDSKGTKIKLLKIYNSFNTTAWCGNWSPDSPKWTNEYKKTLQYEPEQEKNAYWMDMNDYIRYYTTTYICYIHDDYHYTARRLSIEINSLFTCVKFSIKADTHGNSISKLNHFIVNIKSRRIKMNYKQCDVYRPQFVNVILFRKDKETLRFIDSVCGREDRLFISVPELFIGDYVLTVNFPALGQNAFQIANSFSINQSRPNSITVGLYSSLESSQIIVGQYDSNGFERVILKSLIDRSKKNYHVYYFEKEKEKETSRSINFENERGAFGYLVLENKSEGTLFETIKLINFDNVNLISFLQNKKRPSTQVISIPEDIDDECTRKIITQIASSERPVTDTKITIGNSPKSGPLSKDNAFELMIQVASMSTSVLIFEKCDEKSSIDIQSQIVFYYPLYVVLKENKFVTNKNRLKYSNHPVEIYECIIEHSSGVVFYYKNKTKDLKAKIKVTFQSLTNLSFGVCSHYLLSESKKDDNSIGNDNKQQQEEEEMKAIELQVDPFEQKFFEMRSKNMFDSFLYTFQMTYEVFYAKTKV